MVTILELLALLFIVGVPLTVGRVIADYHGVWVGVGAGVLSAGVCGAVVLLLYRASGRRHEQRRLELREKYRAIYRVIALPTELDKIQKAEGAEIRIGDYGWEAEPLDADGLIYLQGLTEKWRVVWYAGFHPDQIERIGSKPQSQYDWNYSWLTKPPPCSFPVQARNAPDIGFPRFRSARPRS